MKKFELYIEKLTIRRSKKTVAMSSITRNKRSFRISEEIPSLKRKQSCTNTQTEEKSIQKSQDDKSFLPHIHQRSISMGSPVQVKNENHLLSHKHLNVKSFRNHSLHSRRIDYIKSQSMNNINSERSMLNLKDYLFLSDRHLHQLNEFINNKNKLPIPITNFNVLQKVDKLADDFQFQNNKQKNRNSEKDSLNQTIWKEIKFSNQKPVPERKSHTLVLHTDYLYLYGGYNNLQYLDDFYRCQIQPNNEHWRWEKINSVTECDKPGSLSNHTAVVFDDSIYFYGGQINTFERSDSLYKFSIQNKKWEQISNQNKGVWPGKLDSHSAQIYQEQMFIFGGVKHEQKEIVYSNNMYSFSFQKKQFSLIENLKSQVPSGRCSHCTAIIGDIMYLFGGNKETKRFNDFWMFNFTNQIWTQVDTSTTQFQPPKISGASMSSYQDKIIIFGGLKSIMYENPDIFLYSIKSQKWKQVEQNLHQEQFDFIIQPNIQSRVTTVNGSNTDKGKTENHPRKSMLEQLMKNQRQRQYDRSIAQDSSILKSSIIDPQKSEIKLSKMESYKKAQFLKIFETKNDGTRNVNSPTTESLKKSIIMLQRQGDSKQVESQDQRALDQVNFMVMGDIRKKHPVARDNHQAVIFEDRLFIFGGDRHKMAFNDMFELDLTLPNNKFSLQI